MMMASHSAYRKLVIVEESKQAFLVALELPGH